MFGEKIKSQLQGYLLAMARYPLVLFFLIATASVNFYLIQNDSSDFPRIYYTLFIGALLGAVAQAIYERFFSTIKERFFIYGAALLLTAGYYFVVHYATANDLEMGIKTGILTFSLLLVFIWIPSIKSEITFDRTFMAAVRAIFTTVLFTIVIAIGLNLVLFAIDQLLFHLDYRVYIHILNFVFVLFFPLFFLSLIPNYPSLKTERDTSTEKIEQAVEIPNLLMILLSYIVIPLVVVYTLILIVYILLNIRSGFWTDNLLEPMLVSYAVVVIALTILVSRIDNLFAKLYRKIVPKVLIPIVLLQIIASVLKINELGLTHGRYYVILFGLFALIAAIIFSFYPVKKSGWIAIILVVFATISIVPPVDAFSVSRASQIKLLKETLIENGMYDNEQIIPKADVPQEERRKISSIVNYLNYMDYAKEVDWLPEDILYETRFKKTFGFDLVYEGYFPSTGESKSSYLEWDAKKVMDVEGYDRLFYLNLSSQGVVNRSSKAIPFEKNGVEYQLVNEVKDRKVYLSVIDARKQSLLEVNVMDIFDEVLSHGSSLTMENATVVKENEQMKIAVTVNYVDRYDENYTGEVYVLISFKE